MVLVGGVRVVVSGKWCRAGWWVWVLPVVEGVVWIVVEGDEGEGDLGGGVCGVGGDACASVCVFMSACMYTLMCVYVHTCVCVFVCWCMQVYVYVHVYICTLCVCVCVCVCLCSALTTMPTRMGRCVPPAPQCWA